MIFFDEEKWNKNVAQYDLIDKETNKVLETKYILRDDAALLNRVYIAEDRGVMWSERGPSAKKSRKKKNQGFTNISRFIYIYELWTN